MSKQKSKKKEEKKVEKICRLGDLFHFADTTDKVLIFFGLLAAIANGFVYPAFTLIFGGMTNAFAQKADPKKMVELAGEYAIYFLVVGAGAFALSFVMFSCWMIAATRQSIRMRVSYFNTLMRQDIAWHDGNNPNTMATKISNDAIQIQTGIGEKFGMLVMFVCMSIGGIGVGFLKGWKMSLVMLAGLPPLAFGAILMIYMLTEGQTKINNVNMEGGALVEESVAGIKTVKALNSQQFTHVRYMDIVSRSKQVIIKYGFSIGAGLGFMFFFMFLDYALAFYYGGTLISDKEHNDNTGEIYKVSDVMTIFFSVMIGGFALGQAGPCMKSITQARVSMQNYLDLAALNPTIVVNDPSQKNLTELQGHLELRNATFTYPGREKKILDNVDIKFLSNKKNALVAESGQGKSTIMQLLERFYDLQEGQVLVDGMDIKDINLKSYRSLVGYVGQEPVLFGTTIKENLLYGKEDATDEDMIAALKQANAWEFVEKTEKKLDAFVGIGGGQFSGGQKQRIAIARALLKNPRVLFLDEATSALDKQNEQLIQATLDEISKERTTVTIAHRLSTIMDSDMIFVIDNGKVVQQGTHEVLMSQEGKYKSLATLQQRAVELEVQEEDNDVQEENINTTSPAQVTISRNNNQVNVEDKMLSQNNLVDEEEEELDENGNPKEKKTVDKKTQEMISKRINGMRQGVSLEFYGGIFFSLIYGVCMPLVGAILSKFIGDVSIFTDSNKMMEEVKKMCIYLVIISVAIMISQTMSYYLLNIVGQNVSDSIREKAMLALLNQPASFFDKKKNSPGQLTSQLTQDCQLINSIASQVTGMTFNVSGAYLLGMTLAFLASWRITLIAIALSPLMVIASAVEAQMAQGFSSKTDGLFKEAGQVINESICNIRTVASFGNQEYVQGLYTKKIEGPLKACDKNGIKAGIAYGFSQMSQFVLYAVIFYCGALFIRDYNLSIKDMFSALFCIMFAAFSMGQASMYIPDIGTCYVAARSIFSILDQPSEAEQAPVKLEQRELNLSTFQGKIEFQKVCFRYPNRKTWVLRDLDMVIPAGQKVAMVGPSGCGKSTVMSLLLRFYEPQSGSILIDDVDIRHYSHHTLRSLFGVVSQEPIMFNGSVRFNVMFNTQATEQDMIEAVKQANAYEFITNDKFEVVEEEEEEGKQEGQGFDRLVGSKGSKISGGQKQRLAIARAILKQPKMLLLDEATSALDQNNEQVVQNSLDAIMGGKTTLSIAHRISTIKNSNIIYMFTDGKIVEQGTYDELLSKQGYFYKFERGAL